ncbi:hypothetical protein GGI12_001172 [Dipsacomyces acuminosporus]|nr:hypothetical protein GGI12_001172 [Dipsacomyces acuminosporus]
MPSVTDSEFQGASPILSWKNLNYDVKAPQKGVRRILHDISGEIYPGELVAIMGSSGAGGRLYGDIKFNGAPRDPSTFKRMLAYVEQDDLMFASLTVEETLLASARLRLSNEKYTDEDKKERVSSVLRQLRLSHVKDTKIGGYGVRGVSGGERKRVSIGVELVTDPSILVLDEPSSGLDSSSAEMVVSLTKEMSRQRNLCTLMTIHQPSAEMVAKFDKLILLAQGKLVYMGPAKDAVPYFEHLGHPLNNPNPANFFIDLMTIDFTSDKLMHESEQRVQRLVDSFAEFRGNGSQLPQQAQQHITGGSSGSSAAATFLEISEHDSASAESRASSEKSALAVAEAVQDITLEEAKLAVYEAPPLNSWVSEVLVLLKRDWQLCTRNRSLLLGLLAECLVTMIFTGFVFFQMGHSQSSVQNRTGALFALTIHCTFPVVFPVIAVIMMGNSVLLRERSSGTYRMTSFFLAKSLSFVPLVFIPYFVMYVGIYFIAHLQYDAAKFFIGLANVSAILFASLGFAFAVSMTVRDMEIAYIIAPVTLATLMLFAGNLSNAYAITPVLRWIKYVCIFYYAYAGFMQNEFSGLRFNCDGSSAICYRTGEEVIHTYGLNQIPIWQCIVTNLALAIGLYIAAYCLLRWKAKPRYLWI